MPPLAAAFGRAVWKLALTTTAARGPTDARESRSSSAMRGHAPGSDLIVDAVHDGWLAWNFPRTKYYLMRKIEIAKNSLPEYRKRFE